MAKNLENSHESARIKIIEKNKERAEYIANELNNSLVINSIQMEQTLSAFGHNEKISNKILIIGGGNISKTAKFVGMERSALHRKLKGLGVKDLN